jgi:protocatechuate 4,5-dioxygenase beta chain
MSGDPQGRMSGWVDEVFDAWVLARLERGRSVDLARVWDVPSRNLLSGTTEVRLWMIAAAALESAGCRARVHDYMPVHHAAAGLAFVTWEN